MEIVVGVIAVILILVIAGVAVGLGWKRGETLIISRNLECTHVRQWPEAKFDQRYYH